MLMTLLRVGAQEVTFSLGLTNNISDLDDNIRCQQTNVEVRAVVGCVNSTGFVLNFNHPSINFQILSGSGLQITFDLRASFMI